MTPETIALIVTSLISLISAMAAAMSAVRRGEFESLQRRVEVLEADLKNEREAHAKERDAHAATRKELAQAYAQLHQCQVACPLQQQCPHPSKAVP